MKYILYADCHMDTWPNYPGKYESDLNSLRQVYEYAKNNKIESVFNLGDTFEKNDKIDCSVYSSVFSLIEYYKVKYGIVTFFIPGNHDIKRKSDIQDFFDSSIMRPFGDESHQSKDGNNIIAWQPIVIGLEDGASINLIPFYRKSDDLIYALNNYPKKKGGVLIGHFSVAEYEHAIGESISIKSFDYKFYKRIFLGHIHKMGAVKNIVFIGALNQRNFSDEGNPTNFCVYDTKEDVLTFVPVKGLKFKTFMMKDQEEYDDFLKKYKKGEYSEYIVRIKYGKDFGRITRIFGEALPEKIDAEDNREVFDVSAGSIGLFKRQVDMTYDGKKKEKIIELGTKIIEGN
jgi:DNA repair exonuclease SbcCD nuclease subunit